MSDKSIINSEYFKLKTLDDVKSLIEDVLAEARDGNDMFDSSSKLASLLNVWIRANSEERENERMDTVGAAIKELQEESARNKEGA